MKWICLGCFGRGDMVRVRVMVFNTTFSNISVISWRSVLLVEETGVPGENHQPTSSHWQTWSHNVVWSKPLLSGIKTHNVSGDRPWLDLQLPMQSVPITTKVVSLNPAHGKLYSIQHYVIKFVSHLRQVDGILWVLRFPSPIKLTGRI